MRHTLPWISALALLAGATAASAQTYQGSTFTTSFSSIDGLANTTTQEDGNAAGFDETKFGVALPTGFVFEFFGDPKAGFTLDPNGRISFNGGGVNTFLVDPLGTPGGQDDDFIALFWHDLEGIAGSKILTRTEGAAPSRVFVIEFLRCTDFATNAATYTGQIRLYETSSRIELIYPDVSQLSFGGTTTVIGIENSDGSIGIGGPNATGETTTPPATSFRFDPVGSVDLTASFPMPAPTNLFPGDAVAIDALVSNIGNLGATSLEASLVLSEDALFDASDIVIDRQTVGTGSLSGGASATVSFSGNLPTALAERGFRFLVVADPDDGVAESSESNNVGASAVVNIGAFFTVTQESLGFTTIDGVGGTVTLFQDANGVDEGRANIAAPFPIAFANRSYDRLQVDINGLIVLGNAPILVNTFINATLPSANAPNALLAPFWDDLETRPGTGKVLMAVQGAAPNRTLVIEYVDMHEFSFGTPTASINTQVQISEATGEIVFAYPSGGVTTTGTAAVAGIESDDGLRAVNGFGLGFGVNPTMNLRFTPSFGAGLDLRPSRFDALSGTRGAPGSSLTYSYEVRNLGQGTTAATSVALVLSSDTVIDPGDTVIEQVPVPALMSGESTGLQVRMTTLPMSAALGQAFLLLDTDDVDANVETVETDNVPALGFTVGSPGYARETFALGLTSIAGMSGTVVQVDGANPPAAGVAFTLPFDVPVFGINETDLTLNLDGSVNLGGVGVGGMAPVLRIFQDLNAAIVPTSQVLTRIEGSMPNRVAVIEYSGFTSAVLDGNSDGLPLGSITAQARLFEASGLIELHYPTTGNDLRYAIAVVNLTGRSANEVVTGPSLAGQASVLAENIRYSPEVPAGIDLVAVDVSSPRLSVNGVARLSAGATTTFDISVANRGSTASGAFQVGLFFDTGTVTASSPRLGTGQVTMLGGSGTATVTIIATIPAGTADGAYNIAAIVDELDDISEIDETNNTADLSGIIDLRVAADSDLSPSAISSRTARSNPQDSFVVDVTINNLSAAACLTAPRINLVLSLDRSLDAGDPVIGSVFLAPLAASSSALLNIQGDLPSGLAPGNYFLGVIADADDVEAETNETNNALFTTSTLLVEPLVLNAGGVDLTSRRLTGTPRVAVASSGLSLSFEIANFGDAAFTAPAQQFSIEVILADDAALMTNPVSLGILTLGGPGTTGSIEPGEGLDFTISAVNGISIPAGTADGDYFVGINLDSNDDLSEPDETNNLTPVVPIRVTSQAFAELQPDLLLIDATPANAGDTRAFELRFSNPGNIDATAFEVSLYASTDAMITTADTLLGTFSVTSLSASASMTLSDLVTLPSGLVTGSYVIGAILDSGAAVPEAFEGDNAIASLSPLDVTGLPPTVDLEALSVSATPSFANRGGSLTVTRSLRNNGTIPATGFEVTLVLSTDTSFDAGDIVIDTTTIASLAAGATDGPTPITVTLPTMNLPNGAYFVGLVLDDPGALTETDEGNNVIFSGQTITIQDAVLGDVNGDAAVNAADIQLCVNQILLIDPATPAADVNGDSSVNAADLQRIINIVLGIP